MDQLESNRIFNSVKIFSDMPLQYYGGGEKLIIVLSNYLHSKGIDVVIFQEHADVETRVSFEEIKKLIELKINNIRYIKYLPKFLYQGMPNLNEFSKSTLNLMFLYRIPPKRYLKKIERLDVRLIFCIHGITTVIPVLSFKLLLFNFYKKFALNYFSKFLIEGNKIKAQVLTKTMERLLYSNGADKKNIYRIPNGVAFDNFSVGKNNDQFLVIFTGRMVNIQKGIVRLVKVVEKLPSEISVTIIGSGPDTWLLNNLRLENVEILGFISEEEKNESLKRANLLISTSNLEPFSLVILEGLASGLPCVATPAEGPLEILSQEPIFGTVSSFNPDQFAKDVITYFEEWKTNKESYFQDKIKRRETARKYYDESVMLEEYYKIILAN